MQISLPYRIALAITLVSTAVVVGWLSFRLAEATAEQVEEGTYSKLYESADKEWVLKNHQQAAILYRELVARDQFDGVAHYRLAISILNYIEDAKAEPVKVTPDANSGKSEADVENETRMLMEEAKASLTACAEYRRWRLNSNYQLARLYHMQEQYELAMDTLREIRDGPERFIFWRKAEYFPTFVDDPEFQELQDRR